MRSGQHQRKTTGLGCGDHVVTDQLIAAWALGQSLVEPLELGSRIGGWKIRRTEACWTHQHVVNEWPRGRLLAGVVTEAHGAALHENNRLMAVFARGRGRETGNVARLGPAGDQFKAAGGEMVAFIHHQVAIRSHAIMHDTLPYQTLYECHIKAADKGLPATSEPADGLRRHIKEGR